MDIVIRSEGIEFPAVERGELVIERNLQRGPFFDSGRQAELNGLRNTTNIVLQFPRHQEHQTTRCNTTIGKKNNK